MVEKLEITVNEYNVKIEDLNRTVSDVSSAKQRLQMEAQESAKKLNEMKLSLEHAGLDKNKFATQLDELRRGRTAARRGADESLSSAREARMSPLPRPARRG